MKREAKIQQFSPKTFFSLVDAWSFWFEKIEHMLPDPETVNPVLFLENRENRFYVFSLDGALAGEGRSEEEAASDAIERLHFKMDLGNFHLSLDLN